MSYLFKRRSIFAFLSVFSFSCAGDKSSDSSASSSEYEHHSSPGKDWPVVTLSGEGKDDELVEKENLKTFVDKQLTLALNIAEEAGMIVNKAKLGPEVTGIESIDLALSKREHFKFDDTIGLTTGEKGSTITITPEINVRTMEYRMSYVLAYGDLSREGGFARAQKQGGTGTLGTIWGPKITNNLNLTLSDLILLLGVAKTPVAATFKSQLAKFTNLAATEKRNISSGGTFRRPVSAMWTLKTVLANKKMFDDFDDKGIQVTGFTEDLFNNVVRVACEEHLKKKGNAFGSERCNVSFADALEVFHYAITSGLNKGVPHTLPVKSCSSSDGVTFFHVMVPFESIKYIEEGAQDVHFVNVSEISRSSQESSSDPDYRITVFTKVAFDRSQRKQTIELSDKSCGDHEDVMLFSRSTEFDYASITSKMVCYRMPLNIEWFGGKLSCNPTNNKFSFTDEWWWGRDRKERKGIAQKKIPIRATLYDFRSELDANFKGKQAQFELNSSNYNLGMLGVKGVYDARGENLDLFPGNDFSKVEVVFK